MCDKLRKIGDRQVRIDGEIAIEIARERHRRERGLGIVAELHQMRDRRQGRTAELKQPHLARQFQHPHEQRFDVLEKASPKRRDGVMVGMLVHGDEPERHRIVGRPLQLAARTPRSHSRKPTVPTTRPDDSQPSRCPDSSSPSPTGPTSRSPPQQTAPGVVREAIHQATAEAEIPSRDQTRGNCSSMGIQAANQLRQNTLRRV